MVKLELFASGLDFQKPVTRIGSAEEGLVGQRPWVFVFYGDDDNAKFAEAQQAYYLAGRTFVILTETNQKCRVLIIGNPPNKFSDGSTEYDFSATGVASAFTVNSTTFSSVVNNLMLTESLSASAVTTVPYVGGSLPMTAVCELDRIDSDTKFTQDDLPIQLQRIVAKVSAVNLDANFNLRSVTVMNVPRNGRFYQSSTVLKNNTGNLTYYLGNTATETLKVDWIAPVGTSSQSTETNPIYVYETRKEEQSAIIIRGVYNSNSYFYRLPFTSASNNSIDILRNKHYIFRIKSVTAPGYLTVDEAMNSASLPGNAVLYDIDVIDESSHEIADNGQYYLGVSHSEVHVHWFGAFTANDLANYFGNDPSVVITTNAPSSVQTSVKAATTGGGTLSAVTTGPSSTTINVTGSAVSTELRVIFDRDFKEGYIDVQVGNLAHRIFVKRKSRMSSLEFTEALTTDDGGYVSAKIEKGHEWFKVSFSNDKSTATSYVESPSPAGGDLYMFGDNFLTMYRERYRDGIATFVRAKDSRRVKVYLDQMSTIQTGNFGYVATFHRYNEMGERLIIMYPTNFDNYGHVPTLGGWKARIIAGEDFINIDKVVPAGRDVNDLTKNGWYGQDIESGSGIPHVEDQGTILTGNCAINVPIYFRIGMKNRLVSADAEPRFGAVLLSFNDGQQEFLILVRQGEKPVEVYGPGKWAVSNLADPTRIGGGSDISGHTLISSQAPYTATSFADYPSQAGALFIWGRSIWTGGAYKHYALNPSNPPAGQALNGYPQNAADGVWSEAKDPCPAGYMSPPLSYYSNQTGGLAQYSREVFPMGSRTYPHNNRWGYIADGFFDRMPFESAYQFMREAVVASYNASTGESGIRVAYAGRVFYNPETYASVFFPAIGTRLHSNQGKLQSEGSQGYYMGESSTTIMTFGAGSTVSSEGGLGSGSSAWGLRCVKK